jgi:hypothetical protein
VTITHEELADYLATLKEVEEHFRETDMVVALAAAGHSRKAGEWLWRKIGLQPLGAPTAADIPECLRPPKPVLGQTKRSRDRGRKELLPAFHRKMRQDPGGTVRNVCRDLYELITRAAGKVVFATHADATFHLRVTIPRRKTVTLLDATANAELLRAVFAPRPVEVLGAGPVRPAGRVIQFMDSNGPRSYLNKLPGKVVRILDALGDRHPVGEIVLISHKSCVNALAAKSRHLARIKIAHFGALRGRNDLEPGEKKRIACHVVVGSPKTTEEDRRQLALAVYGRGALPLRNCPRTGQRLPRRRRTQQSGRSRETVGPWPQGRQDHRALTC